MTVTPVPLRCHYCGVPTRKNPGSRPAAPDDRTRDHIVPLGRGGSYQRWNWVVACRRCNEGKGVSWPTCRCDFCTDAVLRASSTSGQGLYTCPACGYLDSTTGSGYWDQHRMGVERPLCSDCNPQHEVTAVRARNLSRLPQEVKG